MVAVKKQNLLIFKKKSLGLSQEMNPVMSQGIFDFVIHSEVIKAF